MSSKYYERLVEFRDLINSGYFPLPLGHVKCLEIIAGLNGYADYESLLHFEADVTIFKQQAKRLKLHLKANVKSLPITTEEARAALSAAIGDNGDGGRP